MWETERRGGRGEDRKGVRRERGRRGVAVVCVVGRRRKGGRGRSPFHGFDIAQITVCKFINAVFEISMA